MALTIPKGTNAATLADWVELLLLAEGSPISTTRIEHLLRGDALDAAEEELLLDTDEADELIEEADMELPLRDEGRSEREFRLEQILAEMNLRITVGPKVYPFEPNEDEVKWSGASGEQAYLLLLILSSRDASYRKDLRAHQVEAAYDRLALEALRRYLGRGARGIRFAKNAHDENDNSTRPKKFRAAIEWLRKEIGLGPGRRRPPDDEREAHWEDQPENGGRAPLNSYSDAGVDVVAWWRFADGRAGAPIILAQCTVQLDWGEKTKDIDLKLWEKWIDFDTVPPQTALVLPFAVSQTYDLWDDRTVTAGVIIDRIRLLELLNELPENELALLIDNPTQNWVATEIASLR